MTIDKSMPEKRTLVLCVDRDDDIGYKAKIQSPVIGREAALAAATALALADPEDSDVNAIFLGIRIYDDLLKRGEGAAIVVLAGNHTDMIEGDRKMAADLEQVIRLTGTASCILVSDGAEDEFILPIIQSRIPVASVQRVIVSQMPNLESSYYTIRKLMDDPKISRVFLVPVGLAMLLYAVATLIGYPEGATVIVLGVVGIYILFRVFGIDTVFGEGISSLQSSLEKGRFSFVTSISAIVLAVIGVVLGSASVFENYTSEFSMGIFLYVITFLYGSIGWFTASALIVTAGKVIDTYLNDPPGLQRTVVLPFFVGAIGLIAYGASVYTLSVSNLLNFPYTPSQGSQFITLSVVGGLLVALIGVYFQSAIGRWTRGRIGAVAK
jgi:putative membrane protein